jgi:hypothetical protein
MGIDATTTTLFAPRKHEPVSGTTVAASVANASTPTTRQISQEELQAETHRIADIWNGVTRDRDSPQAGDGLYWVLPVKQWVGPVSLLKGETIMARAIFDPGGDSPWYLPMLRPGPRSGLLTGNPTSKEELIDVPRDYRRESGKTSELNDFAKEMTVIMKYARAGETARAARGDHDVQMSDANALPEGPITAARADTPSSSAGFPPLVGLHDETQNPNITQQEDWECRGCERWKPEQKICLCGKYSHLKMVRYWNAEGPVDTTQEWVDQREEDDNDESSSATTDDTRPFFCGWEAMELSNQGGKS